MGDRRGKRAYDDGAGAPPRRQLRPARRAVARAQILRNFARGVGCAWRASNSLERMLTGSAAPVRDFREFAMLDLDRRLGLPFESCTSPPPVDYPTPRPLLWAGWRRGTCATTWRARAQRPRRLRPRQPGTGAATIETWRQPAGGAALDAGRAGALPRCPTAWAVPVVAWRQAMPGLRGATTGGRCGTGGRCSSDQPRRGGSAPPRADAPAPAEGPGPARGGTRGAGPPSGCPGGAVAGGAQGGEVGVGAVRAAERRSSSISVVPGATGRPARASRSRDRRPRGRPAGRRRERAGAAG